MESKKYIYNNNNSNPELIFRKFITSAGNKNSLLFKKLNKRVD